ncbi:39S ribosomal protein S30, mitochondrial [Venturia canescens]|uniref:39S ribosomal protein S30, mitochondrial n=1 Tax=Venturia canescens TaxID=32260 RepID=UPI001C9BFB51|nr:39S ribosomal protein S30, mitochondrial [Venturia canescens]
MLLVRVKSNLFGKVRSSVVRIKQQEYSVPVVNQTETEPQYPPIKDLFFKAHFKRQREELAKGIADARTVEEKMIKLNMPRYYGFRSVMLTESNLQYNAIDQIQYITRTHVPKEPGLPSYYDHVITPEGLQENITKIKESIEDCLVFEYTSRKYKEEFEKENLDNPTMIDDVLSKAVSKKVHQSLVSGLAPEHPHLLEAEVDFDPRIEAFWFTGGLETPTCVKLWRRTAAYKNRKKLNKRPDDYPDYPCDRGFQFIGDPNFQLRHNLPLPEIIPLSESENPAFDVPVSKYEPKTLNYWGGRRHGTNIPGFWPGDKSEHGFISYHKSGYLKSRPYDDTPDALRAQAILGSWGWLLAQACNLGFSTFNEITYPLTNQMVITNGKWWTFCVYQLNTTLMHSWYNDENPRRNICWMSEPMKLFDKIENGQVHGLNEKVLEHLVKFYVNQPREREGVQMKPYLQNGDGLIANVVGDMKRVWLEKHFKHLLSNRPRHRPLPEVHQWKDIYIRRHKTRPFDKKRSPWEFGIQSYMRRLDEHYPKYIPRIVRGDKRNPKWEKTYYP